MPNHFPRISFSVDSEGYLLKGDKTPSSHLSVICLHGAGTSTRELFTPLRQELFKQNIPSAAFDFVGHGETGGSLQTSSLKQRFQQASDVIESLRLCQPLSIIAASMSGYTAIKLLEKYEVKDLILFVPAVYHVDAFAVPFNQGFSEIIRKPQSWLHTDAWKILQQFEGNLLIIFAENDDVIPAEIIHKLYESACNAKRRKRHLVQGAPHKIQAYLTNHLSELQIVSTLIGDLLKADLSETC